MIDKRLEFIRTYIPSSNRVFKEQFRKFLAEYLSTNEYHVDDEMIFQHLNSLGKKYFNTHTYFLILDYVVVQGLNPTEIMFQFLKNTEIK